MVYLHMERNNLLNQIHQVINRLLSSLQETIEDITNKYQKKYSATTRSHGKLLKFKNYNCTKHYRENKQVQAKH